jgi:hypothetical protein
LVETENDESLKDLRAIVLMWLNSGESESEFCQSNCLEPNGWIERFCQSNCLEPNELRRWIERYCKAIASRLRPFPPRLISPFANGRRPETLVFGIQDIAAVLGRTAKKTERLIAAGKLPVAMFFGRLCAHRDMLKPYRNRGAVALRDYEIARFAAVTKEAEAAASRRMALHEFAEYRIDRAELLKRIAPAAAPIPVKPILTVIEGGLRTPPRVDVKQAASLAA